MRMAQVVVLGTRAGGPEIDRGQGNRLAERIHATALDVCAAGDQHRILEQIVRCAVLLEDDHDVLDHRGYDERQRQ